MPTASAYSRHWLRDQQQLRPPSARVLVGMSAPQPHQRARGPGGRGVNLWGEPVHLFECPFGGCGCVNLAALHRCEAAGTRGLPPLRAFS
eukprot:COSAG01_NODE_6420_length_3677_cov_4.065120_3_plen_90_part_00